MDDLKGLSEIDRALAEALDVDVSPDFAARVRQRIAREPIRAPFWHGWRLAVPVAAAAAALVAAGLAMLRPQTPQAPQMLTSRSLAAAQRLPLNLHVPAPARVSAGRALVPPPASIATVAATAVAEPDVLVPREEIEMYRRLIAAARNVPGAIVVEASQDLVAVRSTSEITIEPIKVDLIIPPVSGEGDRQ